MAVLIKDSNILEDNKENSHSDRLLFLGEMIAGIAHEINNPLQKVLMSLELLESTLDAQKSARVKSARGEVQRINSIVKNILLFAREQKLRTERADLNFTIAKSVSLMKAKLRQSNVRVKLELDKNPPPLRFNRELLQQVIINIVENARQAFEKSSKGSTVSVTSSFRPRGAVIKISDDGPGIPEDLLDRIFDPFFTTRPDGSGIGLSVSRKIMEAMGGKIRVSSSRRRGTTFSISLPAADDPYLPLFSQVI